MTNEKGLKRVLLCGAALSVSVFAACLPIQPASAQGVQYPSRYYYQLPSRVLVTPGLGYLRHTRRCDRSYPMDEWMACGSATGGPVGGRGS